MAILLDRSQVITSPVRWRSRGGVRGGGRACVRACVSGLWRLSSRLPPLPLPQSPTPAGAGNKRRGQCQSARVWVADERSLFRCGRLLPPPLKSVEQDCILWCKFARTSFPVYWHPPSPPTLKQDSHSQSDRKWSSCNLVLLLTRLVLSVVLATNV